MKRKLLILVVLFITLTGTIFAQSPKNNRLNTGVDIFAQGFYVVIDHRIKDYSIGVDVGTSLGVTFPLDLTLTLDNALYFGKENKYNEKTWHVNGRLTYGLLLQNDPTSVLFLVPSVGKCFFLNKNLGLNIDLGIDFQLLNDKGSGGPMGSSSIGVGQRVLPSLRFELRF